MKPILVRERNILNTSIEFDGREYDYFYNPWHYHPEIELTLIIKSFGQRQVSTNRMLPFFCISICLLLTI